MMSRLHKDPRIAGLISHKVDRLLRNFRDYALVDDHMKVGVDFEFVLGNYDNSPVGMLGLGVQVLFAKHYLDNLSQEVKKGLNERMLEKRRWAFVAPLGYLNKDREIIPDPERFPLLREAWERYAKDASSLRELTDWLYAEGLRTRGPRRNPAGSKIHMSALHAMLINPFYYGMMRYKGQLIPGTHEPMVTKATFDRVQAILHGRSNPRPIATFTYRGFLTCGECGLAITAEEQKGHTHYRCTKSRGGAKAVGSATYGRKSWKRNWRRNFVDWRFQRERTDFSATKSSSRTRKGRSSTMPRLLPCAADRMTSRRNKTPSLTGSSMGQSHRRSTETSTRPSRTRRLQSLLRKTPMCEPTSASSKRQRPS